MIRGLDRGQRAALLINECQRGLLELEHAVFPALAEQAQARGIVTKIAALARTFRARNLPVIFLHAIHRPDYAGVAVNNALVARTIKLGALRQGSVQVEPASGLEPHASDFVVRRDFGMAAFYCTNIDALLRNLGVQTLILAGVSSNLAIPGMTIASVDRAFQVVIPEDCVAGSSAEVHELVFKHLLPPLATITTLQAIAEALAVGSCIAPPPGVRS
jgi:nicotinamidase-related amidase